MVIDDPVVVDYPALLAFFAGQQPEQTFLFHLLVLFTNFTLLRFSQNAVNAAVLGDCRRVLLVSLCRLYLGFEDGDFVL